MSNSTENLDAWWGVAETRVRSLLKRKRVHANDLEDLVQTTALRIWDATQNKGKRFESEGHFVATSLVIAGNLVKDQGRRSHRWRTREHLQLERPYYEDLDDLVAELAKRDEMIAAIDRLPAQQRAAYLGDLTAPGDRVASMKIAGLKFKAVKSLKSAYGRLGVAIGGWRLRAYARLRTSGAVATTGACAVALVVAALVGVATQAERHSVPHAASPLAPRSPISNPQSALVPPSATGTATATGPVAPKAKTTTTTLLTIGLGADRHGNERKLNIRHPAEDERGALTCSGLPGSPDRQCLYWPAALLTLVRALPQP